MKETRRIYGKNTRNGAPGRVKRWLINAEGWLSARSWRYLAGPVVAVLCVLVLIMPSAYVVQMPGPTQNVLGEVSGKQVVAVSGVKTYRDSGQLLLVTVNASGVPGYPVSNAQALVAWADSKSTVMPQEAVVPVGQTAEEYKDSSDKEMTSSQDSATAAAKKFLEEHGYDVSGMKVSMHVDDIGGPSAGMMYTLGLIDKVTGEKLSGGKIIAGTGTMNDKGEVGEIGGIRLKMLGAKRDGATWFLAPESNCSSVVGHIPEGLNVVKASTLQEAYDALIAIRDGKGASLPQCSAGE